LDKVSLSINDVPYVLKFGLDQIEFDMRFYSIEKIVAKIYRLYVRKISS